jgi:hypothetical protein
VPQIIEHEWNALALLLAGIQNCVVCALKTGKRDVAVTSPAQSACWKNKTPFLTFALRNPSYRMERGGRGSVKMLRATVCAGVVILVSIRVFGQSTANLPTFEAASIKPNKSGERSVSINRSNGRLMTTNTTLKMLITFAYGTPEGGAPCWGAGFLRAVYQGTVFRAGPYPILNLKPPPGMTPARQKGTLDLLQKMNEVDTTDAALDSDTELAAHQLL